MRLGAIFPQTEIGNDPGAIREYAQAVEGLGYDHLAIYDHVLGADPRNRPGWRGPYTHQTKFHEPLVLFGYLAALTQRLELVTSILILPQRQTVLVAKQAAEIDVLSNGRLRLGVGLGWNEVEYEGLGENCHNRVTHPHQPGDYVYKPAGECDKCHGTRRIIMVYSEDLRGKQPHLTASEPRAPPPSKP